MDIITEFQKHVDECRHMARSTRDFEAKVVWNRMAERWQSLLATEEARTRQRADSRLRRRHGVQGWTDQPRAA
jgi:hypothetical protein